MPKTQIHSQKNQIVKNTYKKVTAFIKKRPVSSFFIALAALLLFIIVGNILNRPTPTKTASNAPKQVQIYTIGEAPKVTLQGKVTKSGIVKISAQGSGIVQSISVKEGDSVSQGAPIISLSSDYQGGNAPAVQAQIAQAQYKNVLDTYGEQTDNINRQKDIAKDTAENAVDLQNLNATASTESASLINDNQGYLDNLRQQVANLQSQSPQNASSSALIQQTQATIDQLQAGQNQLKESQRQLAFQADVNQPPAEIAALQQGLTLQQLDVQQKALDLSKQVTALQAQLAVINAANMAPASPFAGTVQKVFVTVGQSVSSGTLLAVVASPNIHTTIEVTAPQNIVQNVSQIEASNLYIGNHIYSVRPTFVSTEATTGNLYSILFTLPQDDNSLVTDGGYINVEIPVGTPNTGSTVPFIPLDAIYQTQDSSYLLIDNKGRAQSRQVTLGQIYGSYVEITNGLKSGDQIILDRTIIAGDKVTTI